MSPQAQDDLEISPWDENKILWVVKSLQSLGLGPHTHPSCAVLLHASTASFSKDGQGFPTIFIFLMWRLTLGGSISTTKCWSLPHSPFFLCRHRFSMPVQRDSFPGPFQGCLLILEFYFLKLFILRISFFLALFSSSGSIFLIHKVKTKYELIRK